MSGEIKVMASLVAMMLVLVAGANAFGLPTFIGGQVQNEGYLGGYEVTMTNTRTGESLVFSTTKTGHFQFDPSKIRFGFRDGDDFEIECEGKSVVLEDVSQGDVIQDILIDLRGTVCPECRPCPPKEPCPECPEDTTPYAECDSCCEECPEPEIVIVCYDGTEVDNVGDCPEPEPVTDIFWVVISGLLAAVGGAGVMFKYGNNRIFTGLRTGMKTYRGLDGKLKINHKHPGTRGYHSPDIIHRKPENHPKGMIDVSGHYKKVDGQWRYV